MRYNRIEHIKDILHKEKTISAEKLAEMTKVSVNTIRRDIAYLEKEGIIKKFYGGIRLSDVNEPTPFDERLAANTKAKVVVAELAADEVESNDVIFIDSGTTTMHMPQFLTAKNPAIITSSLLVMTEAANLGLNLIGLGGTYYVPSKSFVGNCAMENLSKYNITKAFMASSGINQSFNATNASPLETEIKQFVMKHAKQKYLLVDSSKFGKEALMTFSSITGFAKIFTDKEPDPYYANYCAANRIEIVC